MIFPPIVPSLVYPVGWCVALGSRAQPLEHGDLPDSEAVAIRALVLTPGIEQLEKQVYELRLERSKEPGLFGLIAQF